MASPKRQTKEQIEQNKKKQQALKIAGINRSLDPQQEEQYRKITTNRTGKPNQANSAVLALPAAGYGLAQLLEGAGTFSLPSLSLPSAPAAAMSAPIALTLAGPAMGLYDMITGQHYGSVGVSPDKTQANAFAADATRVNRPMAISISTPRTQTRLYGEAFVNPTLTRAGSVSLASEAAQDSTATGSVEASGTAQPQLEPENDPNKKRGLRDRIADKVDRVIRGKQNTTENKPQTPSKNPVTDESSWRKNVGRFLWETKGNNYGDLYKWRNLGRIVLSPVTVPVATESIGYGLGFFSKKVPEIVENMGEAFERGQQKGSNTSQQQNTNYINQSQERRNTLETNSTNADGTYRVVPRTVPVYTQQQRDSVERLNRQMFQELR